jgi:DNA-binding transcriptional ArsR family regulator
MRALAHPARIAIAQPLALDGPATATGCAEFTGLSPSACSYHLRTLARHGFIEEDPASSPDRRHRAWRARAVRVTFAADPGQAVAARLLTETLHAQFSEVRAQYAERAAQYPPDWQDAAHLHEDVVHVTPGELATLRSRLTDLLSEYRRLDAASRPPAARRVHVLVDLVPWFAPDSVPTRSPGGAR